MKLVNRSPEKTSDVSAARHSAMPELRKLLFMVLALAVVVYLAIGVVVDAVASRISFETEARLFGGIRFARLMSSDDEDERLVRLHPLLDELTNETQAPPLPYRLTLIESEKVNAFAFPGGTIGVTEGLLEALDEDIELAFVLGHELGHFYNRDHLRGVGRAVGVSLAYAVLFGGEMGGQSLGNILRFVLDRGYSRAQEEKADEFGITLVHRVYGRTEGVDKLFRLFKDDHGTPEWAYMFATHPSPNARIEDLEAYARQLGAER